MRNLRHLALSTLASVTLVLALVGGLWWWSGTDTSLASAIQLAQNALPAGQTLQAQDVSGTLRQGGHMGSLRWQQGELSVEARDVHLTWRTRSLLNRELVLSQLSIGHLRVTDQREPSTTLPTPPQQWVLPFKVNAQVKVDVFEWAGTATAQVEKLSFSYIFDSYQHILDKGYMLFSSNTYEFSGKLQAQGPMALTLEVGGMVATPVPGSPKPLQLNAQAKLIGQLAGLDASLNLQAKLTPQPVQGISNRARSRPANAMQANLVAEIAPWQFQPIISAQGQWRALNLAALWPQAPQTSLQGEASVRPQASGWQASIQSDNSQSGPWNAQRLPLQTFQAELGFQQGRWLLQSLRANAAGGSVAAQAQLGVRRSDPAATSANSTGSWTVDATIKGINPAAVDSRLTPDHLSGSIRASQAMTGSKAGIQFDVSLESAATVIPLVAPEKSPPTQPKQQRNAATALHLKSLSAQGHWATPQLTLSALHIGARDAHLEGQLDYHTVSHAAAGHLSLDIPGLQAVLNGRLARSDGQGMLSISVQDTTQASRWLARWPGLEEVLAPVLASAPLRGTADLHAQWQGGWQNQAQALHINAQLRSPQITWAAGESHTSTASPPSSIQARQLQIDLSGTPSGFDVSAQGSVARGKQHIDWQTQARGAHLPDNSWQVTLAQLRLGVVSGANPTPWVVQLEQAANTGSQRVKLNWTPGAVNQTLTVSPGQLNLTGPLAGQPRIRWQALRWSEPTQPPAAGKARAQWQSQGRVDDLPLAWLDAWSPQTMADLGLSSDMLLSGGWNASKTDALHLQANLERNRGDLRLATEERGQGVINAGMTDAWMQVNLDGEHLAGSLRWDSARAGKALLAFSTVLQNQGGVLNWSADAPLGGSLQMSLPPVDAWSVLAPPGWRLRGTVNTQIQLTGTLNQPQWDGTLLARDLAIRSVVDGIDFSQGVLDARLHGQQLDIQKFTLRGAAAAPGNNEGGEMRLSGSVIWLPDQHQATLQERIQMTLQAQIKALRISARPDRRLVVSGDVSGQFKNSSLTVRGNLVADQGLFTLPDVSAPVLGSDVVVRPSGIPAVAASDPKGFQGGGAAQPKRNHLDLAVNLDLGPDFQVRGRGLQARLVGKLVLGVQDGAAPSLTGNIRALNGSYLAYGQQLAIERGVIRFTGPIDNPAVAILAIRPKLTQRVGVQISGTVLAPMIALYADPDLPEAEKLAWLVLGRSASGGGAEAAVLQQAALALFGNGGQGLSAGLSKALGLDELSFRNNAVSGTENAASGTSVTLGKRLSSDFYVAYESSLNGAMGIFYIFYDLSRRLTLRAQTGEQSAIDLVYTLRYD